MRRHPWTQPTRLLLVMSVLALAVFASAGGHAATQQPFTLTSPDFADGARLPTSAAFNQFGCPGQNIAPTLNWQGVPNRTRSFALAMNDYDAPVAGGFHHWVVFNIPGDVTTLNGSSPFSQGTNDFGLTGYGGPCPPATGQIHHYVFTLYALSVKQIAGAALTYNQLIAAIDGSVTGATVIIGTFSIG